MKKTILFTAGLLWLIPFLAQAQNLGIYASSPTEALQIGNYNNTGNYKILIPGVYNFEQMKLGQFGNGRAGIEFINHASATLSYGIKLLANVDQFQGFQIQYATPVASYDVLQYQTGLSMGTNGNVGIGTITTGTYKLAVEGTIGARKVKVTQAAWPDFVFHPDYQLPSLAEVESYIKTNQHLPGIPAEKEVKENGLDLGEMNKQLLQKVEELTLYMIQQDKKMQIMQTEIEKLKKKN